MLRNTAEAIDFVVKRFKEELIRQLQISGLSLNDLDKIDIIWKPESKIESIIIKGYIK